MAPNMSSQEGEKSEREREKEQQGGRRKTLREFSNSDIAPGS